MQDVLEYGALLSQAVDAFDRPRVAELCDDLIRDFRSGLALDPGQAAPAETQTEALMD